MKLQKYSGREGEGEFRTMTVDEIKALRYDQIVWFRSIDGSARRAKVNGEPKRWKRQPDRVEVPLKYGMYEHFTAIRTQDHDAAVFEEQFGHKDSRECWAVYLMVEECPESLAEKILLPCSVCGIEIPQYQACPECGDGA